MKILVTNDDGILASGLWVLVKELKNVAEVAVAAPDREQSATGTSVTLRQPLRVQKVMPMVPGVESYSVEGTPGDSVILALGKLVGGVDLVVSGVNNGSNLGEDVLISGTVGAALQGYLRGISALAFSLPEAHSPYLEIAAKMASLLARKIFTQKLSSHIFLNVNLPALPLDEIRGIKVTRLASKSHIDTVDEGHDGKREYYWLVRQKSNNNVDVDTDMGAIAGGYISVTALAISLPDKPSLSILDGLCSNLVNELRMFSKNVPKTY